MFKLYFFSEIIYFVFEELVYISMGILCIKLQVCDLGFRGFLV